VRRYLLGRLLQLVPVLIGITIAAFLLLHLVPGDPARTLLGVHATDAEVATLRHEWGLDQSLPAQYVAYLGRLLRGDLGTSVYFQSPVAELIASSLPVTVAMLLLGALFGVLAAVPLALLAATGAGRLRDQVIRIVPLFGLGMPPFWVGFVLLIVFAITLRIFPAGGYGTTLADHLVGLILPSLTVAAVMAPILVRSLRAALIEVLGSDFVTAATAKGLPPTRILLRHALRNALTPAISVLAVSLGYLLGGSVVIEDVFGLPGVGHLLLAGIFNRDFDVVQSVTLVYALLVVAINLAADLAYAAADPRVALGR
jgi:peptide/nickel transport system permease protein